MAFVSDHTENEATKKVAKDRETVARILALPAKERELMRAVVEILTIQGRGNDFKIEEIAKGKKK